MDEVLAKSLLHYKIWKESNLMFSDTSFESYYGGIAKTSQEVLQNYNPYF